ncbi:GerAB/ArcD/ProY family transporter [Alicyclobacillus mengziensis]|uniref:GerAB/ArcD/ProY family transporter n=1 Tax=Alicyclobacillus mengziensis TaxID=2931921 RepID=UPI00201114B5|nr:GerAB/ArcD/ProY family transporter [Alicyclobacillus mengziensis]
MYKLSKFQIICVLSTSFLPLLFWIFPRYAAYQAGADGQWAVLGACLVGLFSAYLHGLLNTYFPKQTGVEMATALYGKVLGKLVVSSFIPGYLLFVSISLYSYSITVKQILPNTPRLATAGALALVSVIGAMYGIEAISRVASITFPVVMFVLSLSYIFVFFRGAWTGVFLHPVSITRSISGAVDLLPIFFGQNLYLMLSPYYDRRKRNALWLPLVATGIGSIYVIVVYIVSIRVVGYEGLRVLAHPVDFVLQLVQLQGLIIQRFGIGLIFISTMFQAVFYANHLWALSELSRRMFNLQKSSEKWFILTYAVTIVMVFQLVPNQQVGDWIVFNILVPLSWVYLVIEPLMKLLTYYLRQKLTAFASG